MLKQETMLGTDVLDHLGLVAATIDKLGIATRIDELMPLTKGAKTTYGQRVSAMILNGLGFMDDRLYLFPQFLGNKPVERLLGQGLRAEDFNDDALGRCLDAIHHYGETRLFSEISLPIALAHKLLNKSAHIDTTTLTVYGDYDPEDVLQPAAVATTDLPSRAQPAYGYAKNKRFDLKQMTLLLATTGASSFPIWMESHSGNASDKKTLEEACCRMQTFCAALKDAPSFLYVGDAAMYANCVKKGKDLVWLSRVPETLKLSKDLLSQQAIDWVPLDNGYKLHVVTRHYGGVEQRWALIYSEAAYTREIATLEKTIAKEYTALANTLWHVSHQAFNCQQDAQRHLECLSQTLKYHRIDFTLNTVATYKTKGRPKKGEAPQKIAYYVNATLARDEQAIAKVKLTKGRFILATNQLDKTALADVDILPTYKEQSGTEAGFKFIKDDTFEVDSIFLKKPERISALMMVMTLCLMVYSFAQYFLRQQLAINKDTLVSQSGKATATPSMKWVYRLFHGVHVLKMQMEQRVQTLVLNVNDVLRRIIIYFGEAACAIYGVEYGT